MPEIGKYKMVFYALLVCPYDTCVAARDAIQITMKEDNSADYSKILFTLGTESGTNERKWKRHEIIFETETSRITVYLLKILYFSKSILYVILATAGIFTGSTNNKFSSIYSY